MAIADFNALNLKLTPIKGGGESGVTLLGLWFRNLKEFEHPEFQDTKNFLGELPASTASALSTTASFEPNFEPTEF